jgi:hypothetical protein
MTKVSSRNYGWAFAFVVLVVGGLFFYSHWSEIKESWIPHERVSMVLDNQEWLTGESKNCDSVPLGHQGLVLECFQTEAGAVEGHVFKVRYWGAGFPSPGISDWVCHKTFYGLIVCHSGRLPSWIATRE